MKERSVKKGSRILDCDSNDRGSLVKHREKAPKATAICLQRVSESSSKPYIARHQHFPKSLFHFMQKPKNEKLKSLFCKI